MPRPFGLMPIARRPVAPECRQRHAHRLANEMATDVQNEQQKTVQNEQENKAV